MGDNDVLLSGVLRGGGGNAGAGLLRDQQCRSIIMERGIALDEDAQAPPCRAAHGECYAAPFSLPTPQLFYFFNDLIFDSRRTADPEGANREGEIGRIFTTLP